MSAWEAPKARTTLRPKSPCWPVGGAVNAAPLKILPPGYFEPENSRGAPGTTFGRAASPIPDANEIAPTTLAGGADLAKIKPSTDQPPKAAWATLFHSGEGRLYVTPPVNACRTSKSELPRSMFGLATELGVFR